MPDRAGSDSRGWCRSGAVLVRTIDRCMLGSRIISISLLDRPDDFRTEIVEQRRTPFESQADSVMYRQVFAAAAASRGWVEQRFSASTVDAAAAEILGARAEEVLHGQRKLLGAPWNKDHRTALAEIVVAATR